MTKLGGIDLSGFDEIFANPAKDQTAATPDEIALAEIEEDPDQPRRHFDDGALEGLAASIRQRGVIQPIVVKPKNERGRHVVVAGARRFRASAIAGRTTIPAFVRSAPADAIDQMIENIQREDLTHEDTARFVVQEIEKGRTARDLGNQLGKRDSWVSRYRNFFTLHEAIRARVEAIGLSTAFAAQSALAAHEDAVLEFLASREAFTRHEFNAFISTLREPTVLATDNQTLEPASATATEAGASAIDVAQDSDRRAPPLKPAAVAAQPEKPKREAKPSYALMVQHDEHHEALGRILVDRMASQGAAYAAVSFDGEVFEYALVELKLVSLQATA